MALTGPPVPSREPLLAAFPPEKDDWSGHLHRQVIGYLGVLLPWALLIVSDWRPTGNEPAWRLWGSISAYYYSGAGPILVGVLACLAVFFFTYHGYGNKHYHWDRLAAIVAAIAAVGVALFPTAPPEHVPKLTWWTENTRHIHYAASVILFSSFAFYCIFLFTKSKPDTEPAPDKKRRNTFYLLSGIGILACMGWAAVWGPLPNKSIFWPETLALEIFGLSWLVKGRAAWTFRKGIGAVGRRLRATRGAALAAAALVCLPAFVEAQEHTNRFEFTEDFIRNTWLHPVRALNVTVLGPGPVHNAENDCEIHIGAELANTTISDFANVVLEPPNVCKDDRKPSFQAWRNFYAGASTLGCVAEGFIRAWPEHLSGGQPPSNPDHIMELHPMRTLVCGSGLTIDTRAQLAAHRDLGHKTAGQISTLARTFRLWIQRTPHPDSNALSTVAFDYFACLYVNGSESCGWGKTGLHNFARLRVETLNSTRRCSGGGSSGEPFKTILGRARAKSPSGYLSTRAQITKLYAIEGTNFYDSLGDCSGPALSNSIFDVLGIFTIDPLSIVKVLDRIAENNLDGQWVEVPFPVAYIIFGEMPTS